MGKALGNLAAATLVFLGVHSLLASRPPKDAAARLRARYGEEYAAYEESGTPFFVPWQR